MDCALTLFLKNHPKGSKYYGKILEITPIVSGWLNYIPNTFPHYTRHTIEHSEKIIEQLSLLLFTDADYNKPIVPLSAAEAYTLIASAYLHDAGMVASEEEKKEILESQEWKDWTLEGTAAKRYLPLQDFKTSSPLATEQKDFIYNRELRFLIAEFIRQRHHLRVGDVIELCSSEMGRFDFGDSILRRSISNICIAHGLDFSELEDETRFPDQQNISGEIVNVRLMAILLRLGDLLDMNNERACPLLMSAANPIPADSRPHWTQYSCLRGQTVTPELISIIAECENQDEHRVLQDWCSWIERECQKAAFVAHRMKRHSTWRPPYISISDLNPTIKIYPSKTALYKPCEWKFIFDEEKVIFRLVENVHSNNLGFLNELIQNSLDAMRCRLYSDLKKAGSAQPSNPWQIPEEVRKQYPLKIDITKELIKNELTEDVKEVQVITLNDSGIGMDDFIVKNYFLQTGRSYYTSTDFSDRYPFQPISQFGIGFLSVFSHSDKILVETFKTGSDPLKLTLTGPRNYLLLEKSNRAQPGTSIKVYLKDLNLQDDISGYIKNLCPFVEFPIYLNNHGEEIIISAETPEDLVYEIPDILNNSNKFQLKHFPVLTENLFGALYVLSYDTPKGEDWTNLYYAKYEYPTLSPDSLIPEIPSDLSSYNGLGGTSHGYKDNNKVSRVDIRSKRENISLTKEIINPNSRYQFRKKQERYEVELDSFWKTILDKHLLDISEQKDIAEMRDYIQRLPKYFPIPGYWESLSGSIKVYTSNTVNFISSSELHIPEFTTVETEKIIENSSNEFWINMNEKYSEFYRAKIFSGYIPVKMSIDEVLGRKITWSKNPDARIKHFVDFAQQLLERRPVYPCAFEDARISKSIFHTTDSIYQAVLINTNNPFIDWLLDLCLIYKDWSKKTPVLVKGIQTFFNHHLKETIFSTYFIDSEKLRRLSDYLMALERLPEFPKLKKAPLESINLPEERYHHVDLELKQNKKK